jgi:hypothetical protein
MTNVEYKKHDNPTLARDILLKIQKPEIVSLLYKHYLSETKELLSKLHKLNNSTRESNKASLLLSLLHNYRNTCENKQLLSDVAKQKIDSFFKNLLQDLSKLQENIETYQATITCALDGFTLNRTTYLIEKLEIYIWDNQSAKQDFKSKILQSINLEFGKTRFLSKPANNLRKELAIAMALRTSCEQLRGDIGNPETMPRGLVIDFMFHLCGAISACEEIYNSYFYRSDFLDLIEQEAKRLYKLYPDLAEAGEQLQKAVANCQLQKT